MTSPSNRNKLTQLAASQRGARLFRMSVGLFWTGDSKRFDEPQEIWVKPGDVIIRSARPIKSGVEGMSDEVGFTPTVITQGMVGKTIPIYTAIEDKTGKGRSTKEQKSFIAMVRSFGGLAGVARSDDDVAAILRGDIRD